jgi:N-acetylglucosamine kinase-like BadF-type ATPase
LTRLLLGVDGGNSKTVALVAREDGAIVGYGRGGRADIYEAVPPEQAFAEVAASVADALRHAGATAAELRGAVYSLAGADWPADYARYTRELESRVGTPGTVLNDSIGAVRAGTGDGHGLAIVCGTGVAIGARHRDGHEWHMSFWGAPCHRYDPTRGTLDAVTRAELGMSEPTVLQQLAPAAAGCASVEELIRRQTGFGERRPDTRRLPAALLDAVSQGDAVATRVVQRIGRAMGEFALAARQQTGLEATAPLVLAGGVFRHPCPALADAIARSVPGSPLVRAVREPAVGALLLAFDAAGLAADEALLDASLPHAELFATQ